MNWNHRVIQHDDPDDFWLGIHEVYYDEGVELPHSWTADAIPLISDSVEDLALTLQRIQEALAKPVLRIVGDKLEEIPDAPHVSGPNEDPKNEGG